MYYKSEGLSGIGYIEMNRQWWGYGRWKKKRWRWWDLQEWRYGKREINHSLKKKREKKNPGFKIITKAIKEQSEYFTSWN